VYTVQDDLAQILSRTSVAAGRTDKDVSALSQVLSFHTYDEITEGDIKELFAQSEAQMQGRIKLFSCTRVPRRFHALFLATWRRYVYAFPLKPGAYSGYDVDVAYVARQLSR
jgi:tRNA pseudouridine(38-40) synthase